MAKIQLTLGKLLGFRLLGTRKPEDHETGIRSVIPSGRIGNLGGKIGVSKIRP